MRVTVNGERRTVPSGLLLADLIAQHTDVRAGVAVAVDGEVVPRTGWSAYVLDDGAAVEILTAVQGG
ncbi:sulfur carrier protein ThiS [Actinospica sp. MGRD01-02]|uniref:Sulfur carrier protein ThiS n=1 Tax=Actinospica acidithermotolerans TaxID=2828514 RepID=A0A941E7G1_9ACTN|nr:sulfur carrier protein ThiS [Actinospica acidithermotolerans]MBR7826476.1 sulfur carrier protein ThiS [Actinospica acidithermotolerans]